MVSISVLVRGSNQLFAMTFAQPVSLPVTIVAHCTCLKFAFRSWVGSRKGLTRMGVSEQGPHPSGALKSMASRECVERA